MVIIAQKKKNEVTPKRLFRLQIKPNKQLRKQQIKRRRLKNYRIFQTHLRNIRVKKDFNRISLHKMQRNKRIENSFFRKTFKGLNRLKTGLIRGASFRIL